MGALAGPYQRQVLGVVTTHPAGGRDGGVRVAVADHTGGFGGRVGGCFVCINCMSKVVGCYYVTRNG